MSKIIIYQVFPRYFGNRNTNAVPNGSLQQNGCGKLNDFTMKALSSIRELGVTHIWFTGIIEHATKTDYTAYGIIKDHPAVVKGKAGSPYAIKDYYDIDPDLAVNPECRLKEFQNLMRRCHQSGLKVIIDFVPNHLARQYSSDASPSGTKDFGTEDRKDVAFHVNNNFYYLLNQKFQPQIDLYAGNDEPYYEFPARVTGNDCFSASPGVNDWYETVKLNYGVDYQCGRVPFFRETPSTWYKMLEVLSYWTRMGVDGFRCDMAEMVPFEFWGWVIPRVKALSPAILFIAEVYNPEMYGNYIHQGYFDYLYDKVGLYDALRLIMEGYGKTSAITRCWQSVGDLQPKMLYFIENHDEQRVASDFFAGNALKGIPALIVITCMQNNPVMMYSGQELGERGMYSEGFSGLDGRSTIFDYWCIESLVAWNNSGKWNEEKLTDVQKEIRSVYKHILHLCSSEKPLYNGAFFDLMYVNYENPDFDSSSLFAFFRKSGKELILIVVNFSSEDKECSLIIPRHAFDYLEIPDDHFMEATELLTERKKQFILSSSKPVLINVPANSGTLLKFVC
jgi:glycosidase